MSWHFSRALVEEYSAATSSDGEPFAPSRLNPTPGTSCLRGKMTEPFPLSQSGTTYQLSTGDRGEELLTWYLEVFLAKTSAQPDRGQESMERKVACGERWQESFSRFDHATRSWKIPQCSLLEVSEEFSGTWPRWGIMRRGVCSELQTWEPRTSVSGYGFLPTPMVHNAKELTPSPSSIRRKNPGLGALAAHGKLGGAAGKLNPTWVEWLMGWPLGWTDLKPLAMDRFHVWRQQCSNTLEESWKKGNAKQD